MPYRFKISDDGASWCMAMQSAIVSIASAATDRREITEDRLQDAYRTAEFLSKKHRHVKIVYPA